MIMLHKQERFPTYFGCNLQDDATRIRLSKDPNGLVTFVKNKLTL